MLIHIKQLSCILGACPVSVSCCSHLSLLVIVAYLLICVFTLVAEQGCLPAPVVSLVVAASVVVSCFGHAPQQKSNCQTDLLLFVYCWSGSIHGRSKLSKSVTPISEAIAA